MRYALFVLLVAGLDCYAAPELKGTPDELRRFLHPSDHIVSISGDALETAFSDKAIVSLVVTTEEPKLSAAIAANGTLRTQTAAKLTAAGIKAENINNSKFSMSPQYRWFGKTPASFKVVNRMAIAIFEESELKAVANVADESEEMQISDTTFEHTKRDEFRALVKEKAMDRILAQKALYEDRLGVTLEPVAVRDSTVRQRATAGAAMMEEIVVTESKARDSYLSRFQEAASTSFDEVTYEANLVVDFRVVGATAGGP